MECVAFSSIRTSSHVNIFFSHFLFSSFKRMFTVHKINIYNIPFICHNILPLNLNTILFCRWEIETLLRHHENVMPFLSLFFFFKNDFINYSRNCFQCSSRSVRNKTVTSAIFLAAYYILNENVFPFFFLSFRWARTFNRFHKWCIALLALIFFSSSIFFSFSSSKNPIAWWWCSSDWIPSTLSHYFTRYSIIYHSCVNYIKILHHN